jgi:hypothetical protein
LASETATGKSFYNNENSAITTKQKLPSGSIYGINGGKQWENTDDDRKTKSTNDFEIVEKSPDATTVSLKIENATKNIVATENFNYATASRSNKVPSSINSAISSNIALNETELQQPGQIAKSNQTIQSNQKYDATDQNIRTAYSTNETINVQPNSTESSDQHLILSINKTSNQQLDPTTISSDPAQGENPPAVLEEEPTTTTTTTTTSEAPQEIPPEDPDIIPEYNDDPSVVCYSFLKSHISHIATLQLFKKKRFRREICIHANNTTMLKMM